MAVFSSCLASGPSKTATLYICALLPRSVTVVTRDNGAKNIAIFSFLQYNYQLLWLQLQESGNCSDPFCCRNKTIQLPFLPSVQRLLLHTGLNGRESLT